MDTLNLYWWSDMASEVGGSWNRGAAEKEKAEMGKMDLSRKEKRRFGKRKTAAL
jgi:hypothetical protein